jgi:superfamily II DNA or RNA helicase
MSQKGVSATERRFLEQLDLVRKFTEYHSKFFASYLTSEGISEKDALTQSLSAAKVDLNPHQVDAATFALRSPLSKGVLLADEVGLGKTIEAALVISQRWWERERKILLIVPASLRKQWAAELHEKFSLPSVILDAKRIKDLEKEGRPNPLGRDDGIIIMSYEYAARVSDTLRRIQWNLVVLDEAHKLRNVYKAAENSRASVLRKALAGRQKLLLTATPLQNNLMELFGLISLIDETYFGSEQAFRSEFGRREGGASQALLAKRLEPICKRTLRRQVQRAGLINFTNRLPKTFDFTPDRLETDLYDKVSAYLQDPETIALGQNGRHLVTLMLRKILGSSSFAVTQTLEKMIRRLEAKRVVDDDTLDDLDGFSEHAEEWREAGAGSEVDAVEDDADEDGEHIDPAKLECEIRKLTEYRDLAMSISGNAKGKALLDCLPTVLEEITTKGGQRKAVIFTESVRTQTYLRDLLEQNGFEGETVVLNGSNSDKDSNALYKAWLEKHRGTDVASGSKAADMKAAIVEAFRNDRKILISTESGSEGINLQFCSLLINYDLPWNPQRVEQRIGRCHRYGQKIDVTVINFLNRKNHAEARIHQLLEQKFKLFDGVFGSSDEVLGVIESGVDIERRILDIVQSCRSTKEIDEAFDRLQDEFGAEIDEAKKNARDKLLAEMDDKVIERLLGRKEAVNSAIGDFKRALLGLARAELPEARFHEDHAQRFDYDGATWSTEWPEVDERGWRFLRLGDEGLADRLVAQARDRDLPPAALHFDYSAYDGNMADVERLRGRSGWMRLARLVLNTPAKVYDELVYAAFTEDGTPLHPETAERMLHVPAQVTEAGLTGLPEAELQQVQDARQTEIVGQAQQMLATFLNEEEDRLDAWRDDAKVSFDQQIRALNKEAGDKKKLARATLGLEEKVSLQREAKALQRQVDDLQHQLYTRLREIDEERERMLDEIAEQLNLTPEMKPLFTIRWSLS